MSNYNFTFLEKKWQKYWKENNVFTTNSDHSKPKYYVLDMFPYPSGAGLHVGHPLGYIATDIVARYKRIKGFNVLHPMGFDSFGLPAEQYAIKTGQHPAKTTAQNIKRFKEQLSTLGFSYDWEKEVRTSDPDYFKWTQWIFLKLFNSYYDKKEDKAKPIENLKIPANLEGKAREDFINDHRLAYQDKIMVNWCPELGTVLANEEVIGGLSERGGYPVIRKPMRQWMLRITEYAERLEDDLKDLDWPESIKLSQSNWIGKSKGAEIDFKESVSGAQIKVFTTRPDTIYGATYMVLAPEHPLVALITKDENRALVKEYIEKAIKKSDLQRAELDKTKTGVFTGAYAINPATKKEIPIWISDYVLITYGTGAVMAVPGHDQRDFDFATKFDLPIVQVYSDSGKEIEGQNEANSGQGIMLNSEEFNGMHSLDFFETIIEKLEKEGLGKAAINYKLRDWVFTRQRYWGEPIPVIHTEDGRVLSIDESELPLELPEVKSYQGTDDGESPLAQLNDWVVTTAPDGTPAKRETNTMPQWAGSCWYFLRYLDPKNPEEFASSDEINYWMPVDIYVGGAEHAVLHLLYARFWHKLLYDLGYVNTTEPFQKLINQGMIQGRSSFVYRVKETNKYVSKNLIDEYDVDAIHVDISMVINDELDQEVFLKSRPDENIEFVLENGKYICGYEIEKMSKSLLNIVNPDEIIEKYGSDTFRMYEMFLGPIEQFKPWNTNGIDGVFKFIKKFWRLFHNENGDFDLSDEAPSIDELKILHKTIKKVQGDIERYSFNTAVSAFMICANELTAINCNKRDILAPLVITLSPFAPHLTEELWQKLGNVESVIHSAFPDFDENFILEDVYEYPVAINGKTRAKVSFPLDTSNEDIEKNVLLEEAIQKWLEGKSPKKVIVVPKKIVNIVI